MSAYKCYNLNEQLPKLSDPLWMVDVSAHKRYEVVRAAGEIEDLQLPGETILYQVGWESFGGGKVRSWERRDIINHMPQFKKYYDMLERRAALMSMVSPIRRPRKKRIRNLSSSSSSTTSTSSSSDSSKTTLLNDDEDRMNEEEAGSTTKSCMTSLADNYENIQEVSLPTVNSQATSSKSLINETKSSLPATTTVDSSLDSEDSDEEESKESEEL